LVNDEPYKKFSAHIGKFPCVMIEPDDVALITGGSEERRKFIDTILSQLSHKYLNTLIDYNKLLQQRNSLLKFFSENSSLDEPLLDTLDEQLATKGEIIFEERKKYMEHFLPLTIQEYKNISASDDSIHLKYESHLHGHSLLQLLKENRKRDMLQQRTSAGIHKDEIEISMQAQPFKNIASQGQRKTLLFALKLAEFNIIKAEKKFAPLLLLDDVFEKLDEPRLNSLLTKVCHETNAQVFITDTHKERLQHTLQALNIHFQLIVL
jgi:DNA replication and repair protein RecF